MFGKLNEMKEKMDQVKQKLDHVMVDGSSPDGKVKITMSANKSVKSIQMDPELVSGDPEELEDMLIMALNSTIEKAEQTAQSEIQNATAGMLPNIPGLM